MASWSDTALTGLPNSSEYATYPQYGVTPGWTVSAGTATQDPDWVVVWTHVLTAASGADQYIKVWTSDLSKRHMLSVRHPTTYSGEAGLWFQYMPASDEIYHFVNNSFQGSASIAGGPYSGAGTLELRSVGSVATFYINGTLVDTWDYSHLTAPTGMYSVFAVADGAPATSITELAGGDYPPGGSGPSEGTADGAFTWAGSATGARASAGAANGAVGWAGSATGKREAGGAGNGAVGWVGSATGKRVASGAATGAVDWVGTATGARTSAGAGNGAVSWPGTVTGAAPIIGGASGSADGTVTWAGTATGSRPAGGTANGAVGWAGTVDGRRPAAGAATGAVDWPGTVTGEAPAVGGASGSANGTVTWAGTATGYRSSSGAASGAVDWAGVVTGEAPFVGNNSGAATGSIAWAGTVTGARTSSGAGTGAVLYGPGVVTGQWYPGTPLDVIGPLDLRFIDPELDLRFVDADPADLLDLRYLIPTEA